jgi:hypothetical protein
MRRAVASFALILGGLGSALAEDDQGWRTIHRERGIQVSSRDEPGMDLPSLRGQTRLRAPILHVLAVLLDDDRSTEWAEGADESKVLRVIDSRTQIVYGRSHQRWPVQDRDVVMKRTVDVIKPGEAYRVHLVCAPAAHPPAKNVVRVQSCETTFLLHAQDASSTTIDYRFHADPGANSPDWIVKAVSESIPLDTLKKLARQIERTRGEYEDAVSYWSAAR